MKGSIRERSPGHWAIILDQRDAATGQRKRKWHSFAGTKRQAQVECARLISELKGGNYLEPSKTTVAQFLDRWIDDIKARVSPRTHERYEEIAKKNIVPLIGGTVLSALRPAAISAAYTKALAEGRRDGSGGLSPRTVHHMHRILKQALSQAVRWEILSRNPADAVDPPKVEKKPMLTYGLPETVDVIEAMKGTDMFVPALLAVLCGMRRGEIAALRWRNVDLVAGQISVAESAEQTKAGVRYKVPKSGAGRTLALSGTVVDELKAHRVRQGEGLLKLGEKLTDASFVCAQADGSALKPRAITQAWVKLISGSEVIRRRFHDLRHAHATHLLQSGVHPKVASERLGHSNIGITLDLYSHVIPGMQEDAASRVDDAFKLAKSGRKNPIG
ncbi:site-specific integrase [Tardiphaga sp. vice304]|uniref:site-specific integrase n=1 Tax=Tardiphaga sp. vice304 TaxID=2592817 RepID=UPI001165BACA|nr:site-specific integrase [Tardiphaga sp. vice304]QDM27886.1 site-specific integrase [Tardiphaga sp. vice304]